MTSETGQEERFCLAKRSTKASGEMECAKTKDASTSRMEDFTQVVFRTAKSTGEGLSDRKRGCFLRASSSRASVTAQESSSYLKGQYTKGTFRMEYSKGMEFTRILMARSTKAPGVKARCTVTERSPCLMGKNM